MSSEKYIREQKKLKKMKTDKFTLYVILGTALLMVGAVFFGLKTGQKAQVVEDEKVSIETNQTSHDWGEIGINDGKVNKSFPITNTGEGTLQLYEVITSCMCTTAQLKLGDKTTRKYGMHENSNDIFEIPPGETAELIVEYDPLFHGPSGVGAISRIVSLKTNSPSQSFLEFNLKALVIK